MNRRYLIAVLIGIIALSLIGGGIYYFINKNKQISTFNQQKNQDKEIVVKEISGTNGLRAEIRIKGRQYSVVLIQNGAEKNVDYCFEHVAGQSGERNSEIGPDCTFFINLEFSPKENYLMYLMVNSTAPSQKFLYNIKTDKKEEVEDVIFSDNENYFSSCITNDERSIYSGVIYSGESFYQEYSVPSNYAPSLDCRKTIYNKENNTFTFIFNGDVNRSVEYSLNTKTSKEIDQSDPKNQIDKIGDYFTRVDESVRYFCVSPKAYYLLICHEKNECVKIKNINEKYFSDYIKRDEVQFVGKNSVGEYEECLEYLSPASTGKNVVYAAMPGPCIGGKLYKEGNGNSYYKVDEETAMGTTYTPTKFYNSQSGFYLSGGLRSNFYYLSGGVYYHSCSVGYAMTIEEYGECNDKLEIDTDNLIEENYASHGKLAENIEIVNNFDCGN